MQRSLNLDGDSRPLDTQAGVKEVNENNLIYVNCETNLCLDQKFQNFKEFEMSRI